MSPSYKELEKAVDSDVPTRKQREFHFDNEGMYVPDDIILNDTKTISHDIQVVSDGGKTNFYDIGNAKDVDDLAEHWNLRGDEFNCLKAIVGIAKGARHSGTSPIRDANKLVHYAKRIQQRLIKQKETHE